MPGPHVELASSEIATFELAREQAATTHEAEFVIVAQGDAQLDGVQVTSTVLTASASAASALIGDWLQNAQADIAGTGEASFGGGADAYAGFTSDGIADGQFAGGSSTPAVVDAQGVAQVEFQAAGSAGFDIKATASVTVFTSATASSVATLTGTSALDTVCDALANATAEMDSSATVDASGGAYAEVRALLASEPVVTWAAMPYANGVMRLAGAGAVAGDGQSLWNTTLSATAEAAIDARSSAFQYRDAGVYLLVRAGAEFIANPLVNAWAKFAMVGAAQATVEAQRVVLSPWAAIGKGSARWLAGSPVLADMPYAFHITQREYEERAVSRPEETRACEVMES